MAQVWFDSQHQYVLPLLTWRWRIPLLTSRCDNFYDISRGLKGVGEESHDESTCFCSTSILLERIANFDSDQSYLSCFTNTYRRYHQTVLTEMAQNRLDRQNEYVLLLLKKSGYLNPSATIASIRDLKSLGFNSGCGVLRSAWYGVVIHERLELTEMTRMWWEAYKVFVLTVESKTSSCIVGSSGTFIRWSSIHDINF